MTKLKYCDLVIFIMINKNKVIITNKIDNSVRNLCRVDNKWEIEFKNSGESENLDFIQDYIIKNDITSEFDERLDQFRYSNVSETKICGELC